MQKAMNQLGLNQCGVPLPGTGLHPLQHVQVNSQGTVGQISTGINPYGSVDFSEALPLYSNGGCGPLFSN